MLFGEPEGQAEAGAIGPILRQAKETAGQIDRPSRMATCLVTLRSPSARADACEVMGEEQACIVVAAILQRHKMIRNAGAYLPALTGRASGGQLPFGPVLMAFLRASDRPQERLHDRLFERHCGDAGAFLDYGDKPRTSPCS